MPKCIVTRQKPIPIVASDATPPAFHVRKHNRSVGLAIDELIAGIQDPAQQDELCTLRWRVVNCGRPLGCRFGHLVRMYCRYPKLCRSCSRQHSLNQAEKDALDVAVALRRAPRTRMLLLMLRIDACEDLAVGVDRLYARLRRLRARKSGAWTRLTGTIVRTETAWFPGGWWPHLHIIAATKDDPKGLGLDLVRDWARAEDRKLSGNELIAAMKKQHAQPFRSDGTAPPGTLRSDRDLAFDAYRIAAYATKFEPHHASVHLEHHLSLRGRRCRLATGVFLKVTDDERRIARAMLTFGLRKQVVTRRHQLSLLVPKAMPQLPLAGRKLEWKYQVTAYVHRLEVQVRSSGRRSRKSKAFTRARSTTLRNLLGRSRTTTSRSSDPTSAVQGLPRPVAPKGSLSMSSLRERLRGGPSRSHASEKIASSPPARASRVLNGRRGGKSK